MADVDRGLAGLNSPATAAVLNMKAANDTIHGHLIEAEQVQQRTIAIDAPALGGSTRRPSANRQNTPAVTSILDIEGKLGYVLTEEGRYAEAEPLLRQSLDLRRTILGPQHNLFANSEVSLGFLDAAMGRYAWKRFVPDFRMTFIIAPAARPNSGA